MTQLWTRPADVRAWLGKKWQSGTLLTALAEDRGWEPLGVPLRGPAAGEHNPAAESANPAAAL